MAEEKIRRIEREKAEIRRIERGKAEKLINQSRLSGFYKHTNSSDFIRLNRNGTGTLYFNNVYLPLGSLTFTWTSDEDQIFITYTDQLGYSDNTKWTYWSVKGNVVHLNWPTITYPLNFIKTR